MCELNKLRGKGKLRRLWRLAVAPQPSTARIGYRLVARYQLVYGCVEGVSKLSYSKKITKP